MATGPEHYAEAERLLEQCSLPGDGGNAFYPGDPDDDGVNVHGNAISAAQVHATLAAAAATIELAVSMQDSNGVSTDWLEAVST